MTEVLQQTIRDQARRLDQKKQQIKDNQARYYRLLNAIHEVYYSADIQGNITEISPSIGTVAGYACQDVIGQPATFFYKHPEDRLTFLQLLQQHGFVTDYELELVHQDGHTINVSANAHMMFDEEKNFIGVEGMLRDITDRIDLQKQLKVLNEELEMRVAERTAELEAQTRQLQKFSQAIDQSAEAFIITDRSGEVEYVNPAFESINGYSAEEVKGKTLSLLNSGKHSSDFFHQLWSSLRAAQVWEGTIINRRKDGSEYPALMTIVPILHEGTIEFYAAIQQDMSEYEKLEMQFRQSQKMESLGTLVGGIAHDFNNMLAGLLMHLYLAKKHVYDPERTLEKLNMAEKLGYQASEMIKDLLIFSRDEKGERTELVFNEMLEESMRLLRVSVPRPIQVNLDICDEALSIYGDVTQIQQVLMNLLNNARDALVDVAEAHIDVVLERYPVDQGVIDRHPDIRTESLARLSVSDNGCGMPEQVLSKIFDPFFTTKAVGHGTGLGLSMVHGTIHDHAGFLEVESNEGGGTLFHIYLPIVENSAILQEYENEILMHGNGEVILLADDNNLIRTAVVEALERLNYRVIQASDGAEALRLYEENASAISLAILDMVMPHLSGREVGRCIRQLAPALPLIFATGHNEAAVKQDVQMFDNCSLFEKPFQLKPLACGIRNLLVGG